MRRWGSVATPNSSWASTRAFTSSVSIATPTHSGSLPSVWRHSRTDRGFAYSIDAPLDMRMDQTVGLTAAEVLNTYSHGDLARILSTYGEERFAGKIASEIVRQRAKEPFTTSAALVELLYRTIPAATRRTGGHPAKRTFQALRVEVNGELMSLRA